MEIYLDANATTPVLPAARDAAISAMTEAFGNPSSMHSTGLKARAMIDEARARARRVLHAPSGRLLFLSGATEGIQTSVLSALTAIGQRRHEAGGPQRPSLLLYGATEHKAVPEALRHWNALLALGLELRAIPVTRNGRHDLAWLRAHAADAALVCTMAANNETGVISDLPGIAQALEGSPALWMVDCVQALGKLPLRLDADWSGRRIDYAAFSGHKLYAPKGIGLLYVREGAPFTPLLAGGGQEDAQRSGTENMAGIAALGAVLTELESGHRFQETATLAGFRDRLAAALAQAFPGVVFNAPAGLSLPTTLNVSVPGVGAKMLLDLFDAAGIRASGGSACGAAKAQPSEVLQAMGLPAWQTESAVRLSFGPMAQAGFIDEACARIQACGEALRGSRGRVAEAATPELLDGVTRHVVDGACCYVVAHAMSRCCVLIDPLPELAERLATALQAQGYTVSAVLDTHSHADHETAAQAMAQHLPAGLREPGAIDPLGWPANATRVRLGPLELSRLPLPGHTADSTAYLLHGPRGLMAAFVGDTVLPGALGRSDFEQSAPLAYAASLRRLADAVGPDTLLLPAHDYDDAFATTLAIETRLQPLLADALGSQTSDAGFAAAKAALERDIPLSRYQTLACGARAGRCGDDQQDIELSAQAVRALLKSSANAWLIDVREPFEQHFGHVFPLREHPRQLAVSLSRLPHALPEWLAWPAGTPLVFLCRSGNRSALAARALRRLGHAQAYSIAGGLALWPEEASPPELVASAV